MLHLLQRSSHPAQQLQATTSRKWAAKRLSNANNLDAQWGPGDLWLGHDIVWHLGHPVRWFRHGWRRWGRWRVARSWPHRSLWWSWLNCSNGESLLCGAVKRQLTCQWHGATTQTRIVCVFQPSKGVRTEFNSIFLKKWCRVTVGLTRIQRRTDRYNRCQRQKLKVSFCSWIRQ